MLEGVKAPTIDVYTLAASLYYLVTNEIPTPCLARKFNNSPLESPQQFNSSLSDYLVRAIIKGMEVEPENRPKSLQEWLNLLIAPPKPQIINEKPQQIPATLLHPSKPKNITRRNLLKYSGFAIGAMGITWIGKKIWDEFSQFKLSEYQFDVITVNDRGEEIKRELGKAEYFTEDLGNGIILEMVAIPGGTFMMGTE